MAIYFCVVFPKVLFVFVGLVLAVPVPQSRIEVGPKLTSTTTNFPRGNDDDNDVNKESGEEEEDSINFAEILSGIMEIVTGAVRTVQEVASDPV